MKRIRTYNQFREFRVNEEFVTQTLTILNSADEVPKVGKPMNRDMFIEDGVSSLDWDNVLFVRASDELPTVKNNQFICHTGRALKTVGVNKSFDEYLKKKYDQESKEEWNKDKPEYKDYEAFKEFMLKAHHTRWTKHFTLNHFVASHGGGDWSGNKFYYLSPATEMIKVNGKPASLYAIDTFYDKSVVVPDNTVILYTEKGEKEVQQFVSENPSCRNKVFFLKVDEKRNEYGNFPAAEEVVGKMGYTVVSGGSHYSTEEDLDAEFRDLQRKEKIKKSGLHWGSKWDQLEKGTLDWRYFSRLGRLKMREYYDLDVEHEEKEYSSRRGFFKAYLDKCIEKAQEGDNSTENMMMLLVDLARAIVTPKYAHVEFDGSQGSLADFYGRKKLDLLNWDIEKEKSILKAEEDKNKQTPEQQYAKYPKGNPLDYEANLRGKQIRAEESSDSDRQVYLYYNKYLINDMVKAFQKTWFWKGLVDNRDTLFKLLEIRRKYNQGKDITDQEKKDITSLSEEKKFKEFRDKLEKGPDGVPQFRTKGDDNGVVFNLPEFLDCLDNIDNGAKKFGYSDIYNLIDNRK